MEGEVLVWTSADFHILVHGMKYAGLLLECFQSNPRTETAHRSRKPPLVDLRVFLGAWTAFVWAFVGDPRRKESTRHAFHNGHAVNSTVPVIRFAHMETKS